MTVEPQEIAWLLQALIHGAREIQVDEVTSLAGGMSTETFRVAAMLDPGGDSRPLDVVVRLVPADGVLAPYDVTRDERILRALQDSPVPVPAVIGCDPEGEYLGRPALVTAYVEGEPLSFFGRSTVADDPRLPAYYAVLAAIHAVDWAEAGLEFLDEAGDALEGELGRDEARLMLHGCLGGGERAMLDWLRTHKPAHLTKALVHGDSNPANFLFADLRVTAVLDWELALVGEPRIDIGFFAAAQTMFGGAWELDAEAFQRGYATTNPGANLGDMDYFEAVGLFRLAGFLHAARLLRRMEVGEGMHRLHVRFEEIALGAGGGFSLPTDLEREALK